MVAVYIPVLARRTPVWLPAGYMQQSLLTRQGSQVPRRI